MHVVYACTQEHFAGLLVSMISVVTHAVDAARIIFHVLTHPKDKPAWPRFLCVFHLEMARFPSQPGLELHPVSSVLGKVYIPYSKVSQREDLTTQLSLLFAKFELHDYLPSANRALFLDADVIVKTDLRPVYSMQMRHMLAAVPKPSYWHELVNHSKRFLPLRHQILMPNLSSHRRLIQGGFLLFDLRRMRDWRMWLVGYEEPFTLKRRALHWLAIFQGYGLEQHPLHIIFGEQGWDRLDWRWNVYDLGFDPESWSQECLEEASVLHWSGPHQYWNTGRPEVFVALDRLWHPYRPRSPDWPDFGQL